MMYFISERTCLCGPWKLKLLMIHEKNRKFTLTATTVKHDYPKTRTKSSFQRIELFRCSFKFKMTPNDLG